MQRSTVGMVLVSLGILIMVGAVVGYIFLDLTVKSGIGLAVLFLIGFITSVGSAEELL